MPTLLPRVYPQRDECCEIKFCVIGGEVPFHTAVHYMQLSCTLYFTICKINIMHQSGLSVVPFSLSVHTSVFFFYVAWENVAFQNTQNSVTSPKKGL